MNAAANSIFIIHGAVGPRSGLSPMLHNQMWPHRKKKKPLLLQHMRIRKKRILKLNTESVSAKNSLRQASLFVLSLMLLGCIIGRKDSDNLRIIPFTEWKDMDVTPWHLHPEILNEAIDRANRNR